MPESNSRGMQGTGNSLIASSGAVQAEVKCGAVPCSLSGPSEGTALRGSKPEDGV